MIVSSALIAEGSLRRELIVNSLDVSALEHAGEIFDAYKSRGIIIADSIEADLWILNNERNQVHISFRIDEFRYRRFGQDCIQCDLPLFTRYLKTFILMRMGSLEIVSLQNFVASITSLAITGDPFNCQTGSFLHTAEFLRLLPGSSASRDNIIERLEALSSAANKSGNQRLLTDFSAYLRFNDSFGSIWDNSSDQDKIFLFPIWLWWNLTMIMPLRPTEFTLMPYDCISTINGIEMISVRRSFLKGGGKKLSYSIDGDFKIVQYPVPGHISRQILWYKDALKKSGYTQGRYLFSVDYHYDYIDAIDYVRRHDLYRYQHLKDTLKHYYSRFAVLEPDEPKLHLGDTRHLAMINLIISGGSPVICRELAGHDSIDISSHYYSNIASLVECATYEFYRKSSKTYVRSPSGSTHYSLEIASGRVRIEGGWCCSPEFISHSVRDCILSISRDGELGSCHDCRFFRPDRQGMLFHFEDEAFNKERVKADSWFLMYMTESVRLGAASSCDLYRALLNLQNSCCDYRISILNNLHRKENLYHGTSKEKQLERFDPHDR